MAGGLWLFPLEFVFWDGKGSNTLYIQGVFHVWGWLPPAILGTGVIQAWQGQGSKACLCHG